LASLRTVEFLDLLPLPTLEELAERLDVRSVGTGSELIREGDDGAEFFVLVSGAVEITVNHEIIDTVRAPGSFGEIALLHSCVRTATVTTTEPSCVLVIERDDFLGAIGRTTTSRSLALEVAGGFGHPLDPVD
jgi:CRP-like cAMP-binding protein